MKISRDNFPNICNYQLIHHTILLAVLCQQAQQILKTYYRSIMGINIIEMCFLVLRAGRFDAVMGHNDIVTQEEGIVHSRTYAYIRDYTGHYHLLDVSFPQKQIQARLKKATIPPFVDHNIFRILGERMTIFAPQN